MNVSASSQNTLFSRQQRTTGLQQTARQGPRSGSAKTAKAAHPPDKVTRVASSDHERVAREQTRQQQLTRAMTRMAAEQRLQQAQGDVVEQVLDQLMRGEAAALQQAAANSLDGISLTDTASGTLESATDLVIRAEELAVRAGNDTLSGTERQMIDRELASIKDTLTELSNSAEFNGQAVFGDTLSIQAGTAAQDAIEVSTQTFSRVLQNLINSWLSSNLPR